MNYQLLWEAGREKLPFEEKIAQSNMNAIQDAVETLVWQGDNTLGISGFVADARDEGTVVTFETGQTITGKIDAIIAEASARMLKKGFNVYVSPTDFRAYTQEQNGTCCANKPILDAAAESVTYFGDSRIKIVPVEGLEGADAIVAATADALVYATDVEDSEKTYRMFFDEK